LRPMTENRMATSVRRGREGLDPHFIPVVRMPCARYRWT
jgi:hypothetical protein